jgi:hypothetical protein
MGALVAVVMFAACSTETTTAPLDANYTFNFHEDSAFQLDATSPTCAGQTYCHRWVKTNTDFTGQLRRDGDSVRVTIGSTQFAVPAASAQLKFDSSMTVLAAPAEAGCLSLTFWAAKRSNRLEGTWRVDTDCHNTFSVGTLFGVRY